MKVQDRRRRVLRLCRLRPFWLSRLFPNLLSNTDKLEKAGFTTEKSAFVDAPIICELSMALECKLVKFNEDGNIIGEIVNVSADECVLGEDGLIDAAKLRAIAYDAVHNDYLVLGEKVGNAFKDGNKLK